MREKQTEYKTRVCYNFSKGCEMEKNICKWERERGNEKVEEEKTERREREGQKEKERRRHR